MPTRRSPTCIAAASRSLLLHGGYDLAQPFLRRPLVDDLSILVSATGAAALIPDLPPAFRILSVTKLPEAVLLHAAHK